MPLRHEINGIGGPAPQRIARLRGEAHELPYIEACFAGDEDRIDVTWIHHVPGSLLTGDSIRSSARRNLPDDPRVIIASPLFGSRFQVRERHRRNAVRDGAAESAVRARVCSEPL